MNEQTLIIGADHRGFALKQQLVAWAESKWAVQDAGPMTLEPSDDYPDIAVAVARRVVDQPDTRGLMLCGSGIGVAIAANKVSGVRAGHGLNPDQVKEAREHLDLNILTLGADTMSLEQAQACIEMFMQTNFDPDERHVRRLAKITAVESSK